MRPLLLAWPLPLFCENEAAASCLLEEASKTINATMLVPYLREQSAGSDNICQAKKRIFQWVGMNGKPKIGLVFGLAISKVKLQYDFGFFFVKVSKKAPIFKAYYDVCYVYYSLEFYGFMAQITLLWP